MIMYHVTPWYNLARITVQGLIPALCQTKRPGVWLATVSKLKWLVPHIAQYKRLPETALRILRVSVKRKLLTRIKRGIYLCKTVVPPWDILDAKRAAG